MKESILVTGAPGNVGTPLVLRLAEAGYPVRVGVRNPRKSEGLFPGNVEVVPFDFCDPSTFNGAFKDMQGMFLVRPPAISHVERDLFPAMDSAQAAGVGRIVFMSVMGAERNPVVPHNKVEKRLKEMPIIHTILRPTYFMQNLNTTHAGDIRDGGVINIPTGRGRMSFIDARDIADAAFRVFAECTHNFKGYTLTGSEAYDYSKVAEIFTEVLGRPVHFGNPSIPGYRRRMAEQGFDRDLINVTTMMYILARLGLSAGLTGDTEAILGRRPLTMREYVRDYAGCWTAGVL